MVLSAPPPPRKLVEASFSLLLAEEEKRRKAFASVEEAELVRHNARKAQIEQESQQQRAACLAAANGQQLTKPVEDLLNNSRAMLLDKEDEEFKRGILERKKAFEEKEREYTRSFRDQLLAPPRSARPTAPKASTERDVSVLETGQPREKSTASSTASCTRSELWVTIKLSERLCDLLRRSADGLVNSSQAGATLPQPQPRTSRQSLPSPSPPGAPKPPLANTTAPRPRPTPLPQGLPNVPTKKRARSDDDADGDSAPLPRRQKTASRTITFDEVYCNGKPEYKHMIDEWPKKSGCFYMFRCDEHMVHFNKNAIHGAAKHLHSQQHGYMQKGYETAVNVLGYRIPDCTHELAEKNNKMVKEAFEKGYKPLNANHMTKLDRQAYELKHGVFLESRVESTAPSFPNLKNWEAKTSRAPVNTDIPAIGDLYRVYWREDLKTYLVMILPWKGTLEVCGLPHKSLFDPPAYGPKPPNKRRDRVVMASAPPCYVSDRQTGQIVDWAPGFEDGGARVSEREFPVMFFDEGRNFGWVPLRELLPFSFSKPSHRKTPYFNDAADHVAKIRGFTSFEQMMAVADGRDPKTSKSTLLPHLRPPSQPQATTGVHDDVEMTDSPSSEAPSFSGPNLGALTAHLSLSDRRDSNKSDSSSVAMDEDVPMANTSATPITGTAMPLRMHSTGGGRTAGRGEGRQQRGRGPRGGRGRHLGDESEALPLEPSPEKDSSQGGVKSAGGPGTLVPCATETLVQSTNPQSTNLGSRDAVLSEASPPISSQPNRSFGLPARPVVSQPGGRIEAPPARQVYSTPFQLVMPSKSSIPNTSQPAAPASSAPPMSVLAGRVVPPYDPNVLSTDRWASPCGTAAVEQAYITSKIPAPPQEPPPPRPASPAPDVGPSMPLQSGILNSNEPSPAPPAPPAPVFAGPVVPPHDPNVLSANQWASPCGTAAVEQAYITSKIPAPPQEPAPPAPWAPTPAPPAPPAPPACPAPSPGPVVSPTSIALSTDRWASPFGTAAVEQAYITSKVPTMAPWDAAKKTNAPPPPRPSIEIPQWLGPVVTPAETTAATPTPSRPDTATSRTASPREARPGSVPFIDATRERSGGQGEVKSKSSTPVVISRHESPRETRLSSVASVDAKRASAGGQAQCFDVSRYSDGSRTVHRLTVDPVARIASATTSPLTIDPRDFKEAISEVLETNPSSRILKLVSNKDDGKNETLVFESAGAGAGKVAGSVHVRWFVGWLREVNPALKYTNNSIKPTQKAK